MLHHGGFARTLIVVLAISSLPLLAWAADTKTQTPGAGLPGALLMWWICSRRKEQPIGGWLLYFYINLYVGGAVGLALIALSLKNYVPAAGVSPSLYWLWVIAVAPSQVLLIAQVVIGSILLKKREWKWVNYLRLAFALDVAFALLAIFIDQAHFEDNLIFDFLVLGVSTIWLLYFWRSVRVRRVFKTRDWSVVTQPPREVCQFFCVNDQVLFLGWGAGEGCPFPCPSP